MLNQVVLDTERLVLRSVTINDCTETYLSWLNDEHVVEFTESCFMKHTMKDLQNFVQLQATRKNSVFLTIFIKASGKHIGNIKVDQINEYHKTGEYGILLGDVSEMGKGYAKEASIAIINYCFKELGLRKINLAVVEKNKAALELYKKIGFVEEGVLRENFFHRQSGKYLNGIKMGLLKPEWKF